MKEDLMVPRFDLFGGKHCQTSALKKLFDYHGMSLSEEMLLGLGGGIGFMYWYSKKMPVPFIGTRFGKGEEFLTNICNRIGARLTVMKTSSAKKGYEELKNLLRGGEPAYVFADMAYLPYFALPETAHFGGHTILVYGLDEKKNKVYISDTAKKPLTTDIEDLEKARNSKHPPVAPKNKLLKIEYPSETEKLEKGIKEGIRDCCRQMLNPPTTNFGLEGMKKWANILPKWPAQFKGMDLLGCLFNTFVWIELAGTGGRAFRQMYAQFLREAGSVLDRAALDDVSELIEDSGEVWAEIARAALPSSWPTLKKIRQLSSEKQRLYTEQKPKALNQMIKINKQVDRLMRRAAGELEKRDIAPVLEDLRQGVLECYELERGAFVELGNLVNVRANR